jgi:hypothetical protein
MFADAGTLTVIATGGSSSRTLAARGADSLSVRDFGAVGDGTADDTAAIQAALTYLTARGGGELRITHRHVIAAPVYIRGDNITIRGAGGSIISTVFSTPVFVIGDPANDAVTPDNIAFFDLPFSQTQTQVDITDTWSLGLGATRAAAILKLAGDWLTVERCTFTNFVHGITYYGNAHVPLTGTSTGLRVQGCHFQGCNFGTWVEGCKTVRFFDNTSKDTTFIQFAGGSLMPPHILYGVRFEVEDQDWQIANIYEENNLYGSAISLKWLTNVSIDGVVTRNGCSPLALFEVENFTVSNIVSDSSPDEGTILFGAINLFGCRNGVVSNCSLVLDAATRGLLCTTVVAALSHTGADVTTQDVVFENIKIDWRSTCPERPLYFEDVSRVVVRNLTVKRGAGVNQYLIYFKNAGAGGANNVVETPVIFADAADAYRHQTVWVEAGFSETRVNLSENLLFNIAKSTANIVGGSAGTFTVSWDVGRTIYTDGSGNVGMGTSAPGRKLDISGSSNGTSGTASTLAARITDTQNGGTWDVVNPWAAYEFYSLDTSGVGVTGARLRGRLSVRMTGSTGASSNVGLEADSGNGLVRTLEVDGLGNTIIGPGSVAIATTATSGFLHLPVMSGTPTGTPASYGGHVPMVVDSSGSKLFVYVGGAWKSATLV